MAVDARQKFNLDEFNRAVTNVRKDSKSRHSLQYFESRLEKLRTKWAACEAEHFATQEALADDDDSKKEYLEAYLSAEKLFDEYEIILRQGLSAFSKAADDTMMTEPETLTTQVLESGSQEETVRLERIKVPTFSGRYEDWISFKDVFTMMVHENRHLNATQKMQYLKTAITGAAAQVINHLTITAANYEVAWRLLIKRFQNKPAIANTLVKKFMTLEPCQSRNSDGIKRILDMTNGFLSSLKNLSVDPLNLLLTHLLEEKLDNESRIEWKTKTAELDELPSVDLFVEFLYTRITVADAINTSTATPKRHKAITLTSVTDQTCMICKEPHSLHMCKKFVLFYINRRRKVVQEAKACFNCLRKGHSWRNCTSKHKCRVCGKCHHSLLHLGANDASASDVTNAVEPRNNAKNTIAVNHLATDGNSVVLNHSNASTANILLATALVQVKNEAGSLSTVRALLDQGAQRSIITERAAQKLGLKRKPCDFVIHGLGDSTIRPRGRITIELKEKWNNKFIVADMMIISGQITRLIPAKTIAVSQNLKIGKKDLADPHFNEAGTIDMLIGADLYGTLLETGLMQGKPTYQQTKLGWILSGPIVSSNAENGYTVSLVSTTELNNILTKFWEQEDCNDRQILTPEEEQAEEHYNRYTTRGEYGSYMVRLPFKNNPAKYLANNEKEAIVKYGAMERRLLQNDQLYEEYNKCLQEYLDLNQMEEISPSREGPGYYMPHHCVVKDSSSSTKVRVVFNASAKTASGHSLNDMLLVGPTIQDKLADILLRWRLYPVAIIADIEKMYRQIIVHPKDRDFQRIVWRPTKKDIIRHYRLKTVTFGTASAPFQAIRTLHRLADDEQARFPDAVKYLRNDFYVDDLITGTYSELEAIELQERLSKLLATGGFQLRKWNSSSKLVREHMGHSLHHGQALVQFHTPETTKTLGLHWNLSQDDFRFSFTEDMCQKDTVTKRLIVSQVSKLFDPLGWIQPVIITGKIMIQKLWMEKLDWDDRVPNTIQSEWISYKNSMRNLQNIRIPRWVGNKPLENIELHGFCDASKQAMAAAVYVRVCTTNEQPVVRLLIAKTKVAPVRIQTIPRLELSSAVLLTKLMNQVRTSIKPSDDTRIHFWTDSTDVLAWINKHPSQWETYVPNRVSQIQASSNVEQWHHINSADNPADCTTRGITPSQLENHDIWWNGAVRIRAHHINFTMHRDKTGDQALPREANVLICMPEDDPEMEEYNAPPSSTKDSRNPIGSRLLTTTNSDDNEDYYEIIQRFSSLQRLLNVVARCRRVIQRQDKKFLTVDEIRKAKTICIKLSQRKYFSEEIKCLTQQKPLPKKSNWLQLNPYLDTEGVIRVGGRLQKSKLKQSSKHPVMIHPHCHLARLIVQDVHTNTLHGGLQLTMTTIRLEYWIINMQNLVKSIIHKCIPCFKTTAKTRTQLMGTLPQERVTPSHAFCNTGLDFAGPVRVKWSSGRGAKSIKAYLAIFICLATKAMHLELVSDLTSKACIAAIKRFTARRGKCNQLFTDNGTNFVGADRELKQNFNKMTSEVQALLASDQIIWNFIPPSSPHFGGLWEAGVKSVKRHLVKDIGEHILNVEEMYTILAQIESCLNSRPLTPLSNDPNDMEPLIPGHFIIGRSMFAVPEPEPCEQNLHRKWEILRTIVHNFWKRWQAEYLQRLQVRPKWLTVQQNFNKGQLVLVKNENLPPTRWPLARIFDVHPGEDNLVRVVTVKMNGSLMKRPITKLCALPILEAEETTEEKQTAIGSTTSQEPPHDQAPANGIQHRHARGVKLSSIFYALCVLFCCTPSAMCRISTTKVSSGLYIEQIGLAQMQHGTLRIDLQISWNQVGRDKEKLDFVNDGMTKLCKDQAALTSEVHCLELRSHLAESINEVQHKMQTLKFINGRSKRGILGTVLTSLFGVNDEAYKDIENLSSNQKQIIRTTQQQGKLLLKALHTMNETNSKLEQQFYRFVNQVKMRFNETDNLQNRLVAIDNNFIKIQFLSSYQLAKSFVDELHEKYEAILNAMYTRTGLLDCLPSSELAKLINQVERILPPNMQVVKVPINRLDIERTTECMILTGYLVIADVNTYELMQITAVPTHLKDNLFTIKTFDTSIFAVNSNQQKYFEIWHSELEKSIRINENNFIIYSSTMYDFGKNPKCIIKEVYNLYQGKTCPYQTVEIAKAIWKQLYDHNTWIVTTPTPIAMYSSCEHEREELIVNTTTIIKLSKECSLHTPEFTLMPDLRKRGSPMKVWFKQQDVNFSITKLPQVIRKFNVTMIRSSDIYSNYIHEAADINKELDSFEWKAIIKHHGMPALSIIISIAIAFGYFWFRCNRSQTLQIIPPNQPRKVNWKHTSESQVQLPESSGCAT